MSTENKLLVEDFFKALSEGDPEYMDYYTDETILWTAGDNAIGGTRTKAEIKEFADGVLSTFPNGIKFNIVSMTAEDDRVAVEVRGEAMHASGKEYNNQYHFLIKIKDQKILELREYMDTQLAAKVLLGEQ